MPYTDAHSRLTGPPEPQTQREPGRAVPRAYSRAAVPEASPGVHCTSCRPIFGPCRINAIASSLQRLLCRYRVPQGALLKVIVTPVAFS